MTAILPENNPVATKLEMLEVFSRSIAVMRLDKNDAEISGNKLYKLQPWLKRALANDAGLLSCGGAFSNHLYALAAAGKRYGLQTAALVRGMEKDKMTFTMQDCAVMGMRLIPVTRQDYANRYDAGFADKYLKLFNENMLWVPEGGTGLEAVVACEQIGTEINLLNESYAFDSLWVAVGSGGTLAGLVRSLHPSIQIRAVAVMKDYQPVKKRLSKYLNQEQSNRICWVEGGWYRGFGRFRQGDVDLQLALEKSTGILLDPVYTAKLMRRMFEAYQNNEFADRRPLMLHTGGLQGRRSINSFL